MGTLLSPVNYGFGTASKPIPVGEGDDKKMVASYADLTEGLSTVEQTIGQIVTQHNQALLQQEQTIGDANLSPVSNLGGGATLSDVITAFNSLNSQVTSMITILTNLIIKPK